MVETKKTFCRFCHVFCGMEVDVEGGRVVAVRGDRDNEVTRGYTCQKGRAEIERIYHPDRLLSPQKRDGDRWSPVARSQALDEVAQRLGEIIAQYGPDSVAVYTGCGGHRTSAGGPWFVRRWLDALGSSRMYTSFTIDSPSLAVAGNRFFGGPLPVSLLDIDRAEAVLFVGTNPGASHQLNMPQSSPSARIAKAQRRGMKLIVIDPRRSDAARSADIHLQVKPGEDATLLAAIIRVILERNLSDRPYVEKYLSGVESLRAAVDPFDLDYAARRTGVPAELIERAAVMFATAKTGGAQTGTGLHMAIHHNLTTQLVMTINGLCGRYDRPGGMNRNEGPLGRQFGPDMQGIRLPDPPKSRIRNIPALNGLFGSYFEMPSNTITDEILTPGDGQIRALIVNGGNPALVYSDEARTVEALESLDLLVVLDLFRSATAEFADYVFAVKHPFERVDVSKLMDANYPFPFGHYTDAVVEAPRETIEEWQVFWELAMRLELPLRIGKLSRDALPTSDALLDALNQHARVPLDELRKHPSGYVLDEGTAEGAVERTTTAGGVIPNMIGHDDKRMAAGHPDVIAELAEVRAEPIVVGGGYAASEDFGFRMITYRMKEVYCSQGQNLPSLAKKRAYNPVLMHPEAMRELDLSDGDTVVVESGHGRVEGVVESSESVGRGTIAFAFGWGNPSDPRSMREKGSNVQRLIPADHRYDSVTGLALQSAIPVNVRAAEAS
ncbi:MAG: molybdopterin-dependent oxidoreductase [Myxococcota bacterium]